MLFNKFATLFIIALVLFTANSISAATYYVATTGSDTTGNGTIDSPWKTITKGQSMLAPGDTLLVRGGRYYESVTLTKNGTERNPITIKAQPDETPILDGTEPVTVWTQCTSTEEFLTVQGVINPNYKNIFKTKIHSSKLSNDMTKFMLFENGIHSCIARWPNQNIGYGIDVYLFNAVSPEAYGQTAYLLDSTRLNQSNNYWTGAWIDIYSHSANAWVVRRTISSNSQSAHTITFNTPLSYPISYGSSPDSYSIVNHPHVLDSAGEFAHTISADSGGFYTFYLWPKNVGSLATSITIPSKNYGFYKYDANYLTIDGFKVIGYTLGGILLRKNAPYGMEGLTVQNCTVEDCGGSGIYFIGANNSTIENCTINRVGERGAFVTNGTRCKIQYCDVSDTGSTNISFYTMTYSQLIGNILRGSAGEHGNGSSCYINCDKILIAYNYYPSSNLALQDIKNVIVYANVLDYKETGTSFVTTWSDSSGRTEEYQLYLHNTILGSNNNSALSLKGQISSPFPQNYAINNIIDGCNTWNINQVVDMSHNLYTGLGWTQEGRYGWALGIGEINGSKLALNQIFENPLASGGDYSLTTNSPAIGKGKNVNELLNNIGVKNWFPDFDFTKDKAGNPWKSTPSMGAYEYVATQSSSYSLTIEATVNGSVTKKVGGVVTTATSFAAGTEVELTATPNTDYSFTSWSGGATGSTNPITITMNSNKTITATFTQNSYSLTIFASNGNVSKSPSKTFYTQGEIVTLTATPATGYRFTGWSGAASGTANSITIIMDNNKVITANFTQNPTTLGQVSHWLLDNYSGTTSSDIATSQLTANLISGPVWGMAWRAEDWLTLGQSTQAITIPTMGMSPQAGTIAVWIEPTDFSGMKFIFGHVLNNANRLSLYTVAGSLAAGLGANATLKTNITPLPLNQPVHLALSWNGTAYAVYVNGVQKAAGTFGGLTALNSFIDIGNYGDPAFRSLGFAGKIDDIRTYNRALAAEEIGALYLTHDVRQGKELQFTVNAVNAQGIPIVYQAVAMPAGASFDAATQSVTWTPWHNQLGLHTFRFTAAGQAEKLVTVEVHPVEITTWYGQLQTALPVTRSGN